MMTFEYSELRDNSDLTMYMDDKEDKDKKGHEDDGCED
jgi:hypothetical protein